jgi:hypothetical protein
MLTVVTWTVALSVHAHGLTAGPAATRYADWYHAHHEHHPVMPESVPVAEQRPPSTYLLYRSRQRVAVAAPGLNS